MIYCFSGNGNSLYVARLLAEGLDDSVKRIDRDCLLHPEEYGCAGSDVIWVFPIYSWGLPRPVKEFMKTVNISGARHFMVATCGDDIGLAHRQWRDIARSRGWNDIATFSVQMPNTYTLLPGFDVDSHEIEARKLEAAPERLRMIVSRIREGWRGDDVVKGSFPRFKSKIIYPQFMKHGINPARFRCNTSLCIKCGKCKATCPVENITLVDGHPQWGDDCALCLGCYNVCPVHAVNYGNATLRKGQYRCPLI